MDLMLRNLNTDRPAESWESVYLGGGDWTVWTCGSAVCLM